MLTFKPELSNALTMDGMTDFNESARACSNIIHKRDMSMYTLGFGVRNITGRENFLKNLLIFFSLAPDNLHRPLIDQFLEFGRHY